MNLQFECIVKIFIVKLQGFLIIIIYQNQKMVILTESSIENPILCIAIILLNSFFWLFPVTNGNISVGFEFNF